MGIQGGDDLLAETSLLQMRGGLQSRVHLMANIHEKQLEQLPTTRMFSACDWQVRCSFPPVGRAFAGQLRVRVPNFCISARFQLIHDPACIKVVSLQDLQMPTDAAEATANAM